MNEFDRVTIDAMKIRIAVLRKSEKEANERGLIERATRCKLRAEHLERELDCIEANLGPWVPSCPECRKDLGSDPEHCQTCFDNDPANAGHCFACGQIKGSNLDCGECDQWG